MESFLGGGGKKKKKTHNNLYTSECLIRLSSESLLTFQFPVHTLTASYSVCSYSASQMQLQLSNKYVGYTSWLENILLQFKSNV